MDAKLKRYSISVPAAMQIELDALKVNQYKEMTANGMLCDLILRGLSVIEQQRENDRKCEASV